eukprot:749492-Hanusia_phi.AAC.3
MEEINHLRAEVTYGATQSRPSLIQMFAAYSHARQSRKVHGDRSTSCCDDNDRLEEEKTKLNADLEIHILSNKQKEQEVSELKQARRDAEVRHMREMKESENTQKDREYSRKKIQRKRRNCEKRKRREKNEAKSMKKARGMMRWSRGGQGEGEHEMEKCEKMQRRKE